MYLFLFHYPIRITIGELFNYFGLEGDLYCVIQIVLIISLTIFIVYILKNNERNIIDKFDKKIKELINHGR